MRVLDSHEKGHDIWARQDGETERRVHVIGGKDTRIVSLYIYFQSVTIFFQWQTAWKWLHVIFFSLTISWEEESARIKSSDFPFLWSDPLKFNSDSEEEADSALETTLSLIRPTRGRIKTLTSLIAVLVESYSEFWGFGAKKMLRVTLGFFFWIVQWEWDFSCAKWDWQIKRAGKWDCYPHLPPP